MILKIQVTGHPRGPTSRLRRGELALFLEQPRCYEAYLATFLFDRECQSSDAPLAIDIVFFNIYPGLRLRFSISSHHPCEAREPASSGK